MAPKPRLNKSSFKLTSTSSSRSAGLDAIHAVPVVEQVTLRRCITIIHGVCLIVGSIIGSGVFVSPGGVLKHAGSPAAAIGVWAAAGAMCTVGALCFCELGTAMPSCGGEYTYVLRAFGSPAAFTVLWVNVALVRPAAQAVVALACAEYLVSLLYVCGEQPSRVAVTLLAAAVLGLLTAINCHSVDWAMKIQTIFTGGKLLALAVIILRGTVFMVMESGGHLSDPPEGEFRLDGLALSFYSGLFAYGGWNYLNFVTEELQDPYRNLPRAVWIALPLVSAVYVLVNLAYLAVLPAYVVIESPAVAVEFGRRVLGPLQYTVPFFVALSTFGSLNGILFTSGRMFLAAAREGHMPAVLSYIHVKSRTPIPALITSFALSLCLLGLDIYALINCLSIVLWLSIGAATAALLYLRKTEPDLHRPIKVPLGIAIVFLLCCVYLVLVPLVTAPTSTGLGVLMTLTALPVYFIGNICRKIGAVRAASQAVSHIIQKMLFVVAPETSKDDLLLPENQ